MYATGLPSRPVLIAEYVGSHHIVSDSYRKGNECMMVPLVNGVLLKIEAPALRLKCS